MRDSSRADRDPRRKHFLARLLQDQSPYRTISKDELDSWERQGFLGEIRDDVQGGSLNPEGREPREHPEIRRETADEGNVSREPAAQTGGNQFIPGNAEFPDVGEKVLPSNEEWRQLKTRLWGPARS